jgi:hypothetical protein
MLFWCGGYLTTTDKKLRSTRQAHLYARIGHARIPSRAKRPSEVMLLERLRLVGHAPPH